MTGRQIINHRKSHFVRRNFVQNFHVHAAENVDYIGILISQLNDPRVD